jgi:hypothetical protein
MKLYIYHDADHGDLEVFASLDEAKAHTRKMWGDEQEWEEGHDQINDVMSGYVTIYIRQFPRKDEVL